MNVPKNSDTSSPLLLIANWKMNPQTAADAKRLLEITKRSLGNARSYKVVLAPPSVFMRELTKTYRGKKISFAAQNIHWDIAGSHTGEVSAVQVRDAGASYTLVGHAERRAAGESIEDVRRKMALASSAGLIPVLCIGEKERKPDGEYLRIIAEQLITGVEDVPRGKLKEVIVAYEPVWAIGGKEAMKPEDMHGMAIYIRKVLGRVHGRVGLQIPILYGGSIDDKSAPAMLSEGDVDGLLVGRASLDGRSFSLLLEALRRARV